MIKLREAIKLDEDNLKEIKKEIKEKISASNLNAYIDDDNSLDINKTGVPILIKDNINVKDWEITCASKILKGYIAPYNASVINRLIKNNMVPFGRANMDEFAMGSTSESSCYGAVKNPYDLNRVPGGSSGGSASAVGGGIAIASIGSDTGGSIRQPAGFCGCVGLKPTYGSVSRYGLVAYSSSLDQIGPITQDVEDCALLFDIIKGYDHLDSTSINNKSLETSTFNNLNTNRKFKIGIIKDLLTNANSDISKSYFDTASMLEKLGHDIRDVNILDTNYHISTYYIISMAEASSNLAKFDGIRYGNRVYSDNLNDLYINTRTLGFGSEVKKRILLGNFVLSSGYYDDFYLKAQKTRKYIANEYKNIFNDVDIILSPISPNVAPKIGEHLNSMDMYLNDIYTIGVNLAGLPAICIPVSKSNGLPVGIQLIGNYFNEQSILDLALHIQKEIREYK